MIPSRRQVVRLVLENKGITAEALARELGVSTRSVRTYINDAKEAMGDLGRIVLQRGKGYRVITDDVAALYSWIKSPAGDGDVRMPQRPEERVHWLTDNLLVRTDWVKLDDLSEQLFVSRSTITSDFRRVEAVLSRYGLTIERKPNRGIRVSGGEQARRLCLAHGILQELETSALFPLGDEEGVTSFDELFRVASESLRASTEKMGFGINAVAYNNLLVHIAVALARLERGAIIPMEDALLDRVCKGAEYDMAQVISLEIEQRTSLRLPKAEVAYIAIHLAGKQSLSDVEGSTNVVIGDEIWGIVSEMIAIPKSTFGIDLTDDLELAINLAKHVIPLSTRLRYGMKLQNPMLQEIKTSFPLAFQIAAETAQVLRKHFGVKPSDDELGYIALDFALSLEHSRCETRKKNILIVSTAGAGAARLIEYRCRTSLGNAVGEIHFVNPALVAKADFKNIDLVLTSTHLDVNLPVPVRHVTKLISEGKDIIYDVLSDEKVQLSVRDYFSEDLFFPAFATRAAAASTPKRQVLDFLCERMTERYALPDNFHENVMLREAMVSTAVGNRVAVMHPVEATGSRTVGAVAILDEPVFWDATGNQVQVAFLVSFAAAGGSESREFLSVMAELCTDVDLIDALLDQRTWESFETLFKEAWRRSMRHETAAG